MEQQQQHPRCEVCDEDKPQRIVRAAWRVVVTSSAHGGLVGETTHYVCGKHLHRLFMAKKPGRNHFVVWEVGE